MSPPPSLSARLAASFFSRALSAFQSSGSKLQVICTAPPSLSHEGEPEALPPRVRPQILVVLDSSFNPPTRAHLHMATSAIRELMQKQGQCPGAIRLLLLLSVNNADKGVKPAAFDKRLAMMWAFAQDVQHDLRMSFGNRQAVPEAQGLSVDLGLATVPYFHEKSAALAEAGFYKGQRDPDDDDLAETEQVFLVGYDTLVRIFNPKYYGLLETASQVATAEPTPLQKALDPFFGRAKLRVTMRADDKWGGANEQVAYLENLLHAEGLNKVGGIRAWESRIEMADGHKAGTEVISSTYARAAAKKRDLGRLDLMVTPRVRWWIEQENLYLE
ncbi:Nucleotidylyl transferase [Thermothelomyces heterothallicus CBS 203.75]